MKKGEINWRNNWKNSKSGLYTKCLIILIFDKGPESK
jgi:hypothetical protein